MINALLEKGTSATFQANIVLAGFKLELHCMNSTYCAASTQRALTILRERGCKLVVRIELKDLADDVSFYHFVAYDGKTITDPHYRFKSVINSSTDRTNPVRAKSAFALLFPKAEFRLWRIVGVYQLIEIGH
jgi:hypothetical protein